MKPLDLFELYSVFKVAMDGKDIPAELKVRVAKEVLHSLPPVAFCTACPATREWLGNAVQSVIDTLEPTQNERTITETAPSAKDETPTVRPRKARKESLGE